MPPESHARQAITEEIRRRIRARQPNSQIMAEMAVYYPDVQTIRRSVESAAYRRRKADQRKDGDT